MAAEPGIGTTIRLATADDVDALARISQRAYAATYPEIVPAEALTEWIEQAPTTWRTAFEHQGSDSAWRPWVAERRGLIVGYATTSPGKDWWLPPPDGAGELTNLYLDPHVIGTGVGSLLYDHAVADLERAPIGPGALVVIQVRFADRGAPERYLVPSVNDREPADGEGLWSAL